MKVVSQANRPPPSFKKKKKKKKCLKKTCSQTHLSQSFFPAQVGLARVAELAIAALGNVARDDVVACGEDRIEEERRGRERN